MKLRRGELILLAIIWILVAVLFGLAVIVLRDIGPRQPTQSNQPAGPTVTPTLVPEFTPAASEVTARYLFALAQAEANRWRQDAELVSVRGTWEQTALNLVGRPITWNYRFYSAETKQLYFVTVTPDGTVSGIQHIRKVEPAPPTIPIDGWQIDSQTALADWLNIGGGQFLGERPGIEVTAQLSLRSQGDVPTWTVVGYDRENEAYFVARVDATNGNTTLGEQAATQ